MISKPFQWYLALYFVIYWDSPLRSCGQNTGALLNPFCLARPTTAHVWVQEFRGRKKRRGFTATHLGTTAPPVRAKGSAVSEVQAPVGPTATDSLCRWCCGIVGVLGVQGKREKRRAENCLRSLWAFGGPFAAFWARSRGPLPVLSASTPSRRLGEVSGCL